MSADEQASITPENINAIMDEYRTIYSSEILAQLKKNQRKLLRDERVGERWFVRLQNHIWREPFRSLDLLISYATSCGSEFNTSVFEYAKERNDSVFLAQKYFHGRACQISREILVLLKNGYGDGADARWRSLHEIYVFCLFIQKHGEKAADAYFDHLPIDEYKVQKEFVKHGDKLKEKADLEHFERLQTERDKISAIYGESFCLDWGWATSFLKTNRPSYAMIERDVGMDHMKPYHKIASNNVHANPGGTVMRLGSANGAQNKLLLVGASNWGMEGPGQKTAITLYQITTNFVLGSPTSKEKYKLDIEFGLKCGGMLVALHMLMDETARSFVDAAMVQAERTRRAKADGQSNVRYHHPPIKLDLGKSATRKDGNGD